MWAEAAQKQEEIVRLIQRVAFEEGLSQGKQDSMRYERNLGGGIEEFVSAHQFSLVNIKLVQRADEICSPGSARGFCAD